MSDPITTAIITSTASTPNTVAAVEQGKSGWGKVISGFISGILTTYLTNKASLHGVNFEVLGVSSEMVKAGIDGAIISVSVWATPSHFVAAVKDGILFVKYAWRQWREAWNSN